MTSMYHSLTKEHPWVEHLTSLSKRGVGALSSVAAFNHERAPMSCLPDALKVSNWTNNDVHWSQQRLQSQEPDGTQHSE